MKLAIPSLLLLSMLWLASCQQKLYFPDRANTPGLTEALESKLTLSVKPQSNGSDSANGGGNPVSFAGDLAFAPVNHLGLIASYRSVNHRLIADDLVDVFGGDFTGHRWEGGAGYFTTFGRMGKMEIYLGYGSGSLSRKSYYTPSRDFSTRYYRYFLQPALGAGNDIFSATGGFRLAFQRYTDFSSPNDPNLRYTILGSPGMTDVEAETVGFIEPFVNGEVGYKYIKFNYQLGCTIQYVGAKVSGNAPLYMSLGIVFNLAPRYFSNDKGKEAPAAR